MVYEAEKPLHVIRILDLVPGGCHEFLNTISHTIQFLDKNQLKKYYFRQNKR